VLQVCRTLSCALNGAEKVTAELCKHLHVKPNETTADGVFTVMEFECLGACDRAPVIMVNNEHWAECQGPGDVATLVEGLRNKGLSSLNGCHLVKERA
jgi:NADH:ubiquinone oxidoreductase subunit E